MQIRASTALRNEYLQISQLAKVSGEPIYITNKGEADLVIQSIEAYEQREKMLAHRASVLEAELDRLSGAPTYSPEQGRGRRFLMQQEYQIKYLRAAMRDLEGIAQLYLGLAGADSAEKFIDEILHTVDLLRTFPYSGALHPDMVLAEREFRKVICRDYVCVYKVIDSEKTVYIYRIVNGKTDYPQLLY
mgnify:CR=1 FL=1